MAKFHSDSICWIWQMKTKQATSGIGFICRQIAKIISYLLQIFTDVKRHLSSSSSLFPLLSPIHFFYHTSPHAAPRRVSRGSVTDIWFQLPSCSQHRIHLRHSCWRLLDEPWWLLPSPLATGQEEEKERGLGTELFGSAKGKQHIFCFWKMFMLQLFFLHHLASQWKSYKCII